MKKAPMKKWASVWKTNPILKKWALSISQVKKNTKVLREVDSAPQKDQNNMTKNY